MKLVVIFIFIGIFFGVLSVTFICYMGIHEGRWNTTRTRKWKTTSIASKGTSVRITRQMTHKCHKLERIRSKDTPESDEDVLFTPSGYIDTIFVEQREDEEDDDDDTGTSDDEAVNVREYVQ